MSHWRTSVDELLALFRDAIQALIPVAERARMSWREPDAYDDWNDICQAIYRSIVISSIEHADGIGAFMPMLNYDVRTGFYGNTSFIGADASKEKAAFVCFETEKLPFDRCRFAVLDPNFKVASERRLPTADVRFSFVGRLDDGTLKSFDRVAVSL